MEDVKETEEVQTEEEVKEEVVKDILEDESVKEIFKEEEEENDSESEETSTDNESESTEDETSTDEQTDDKTDDIVPVIPAKLIEDAVRSGMSLEEAQGYKDAVELATVTSVLKEQAKEPEKEEEVKEPEQTALDRLLEDEDMDEDLKEVLKVVNEQNKAMTESIKKVEEGSKSNQDEKQREAQIAYEKEFDGAINDLGEDAKKLLGDGDIHSLKGDEADNRRELYSTVNALAYSLHQQGKKVPSTSDLINLAGASLWKDSFQSEKSEIGKKLKKQSQNLINKPGQRQLPVKEAKDGREEAEDAVKAYLKKNG